MRSPVQSFPPKQIKPKHPQVGLLAGPPKLLERRAVQPGAVVALQPGGLEAAAPEVGGEVGGVQHVRVEAPHAQGQVAQRGAV